jgi:tetratricopeptide (TPR) repeat protein
VRGHDERWRFVSGRFGNSRLATDAMSGPSPLSRGRRRTEPRGPVGKLIAEYRGARTLDELVALYVKAANETEGTKHATGSRATFFRWLRGERIPDLLSQRRLAAALGIPIERLEAAIKAQDQQGKTPQSATVESAVDSDDVKRREFLATLGTFAAPGFDLDRFAAVLAGTRADASVLDDFERITLDLIRQEPTVSPQSLMPAVRGHLAGLRDVLVWTSPALAPRAYSLAGQAALLAGYLGYRQANYASADGYWFLAERFGEVAGDARLGAALLELRASRWSPAYDIENLPIALGLLDRAVALLGSSPDPATAAYILSFRARKYAEASRAAPNYTTPAMRDLDSVQTHLSRMPADTSVYIVESVTGETVQGHGRALVHLGRPDDAVVHLQRLLASVQEDSRWWRAGILADLAAAHAANGEPEHASDLLGSALRLAADASDGHHRQVVRQARQRWLTHHDGPSLRRLDDQLQALPTAAASTDAHPPFST